MEWRTAGALHCGFCFSNATVVMLDPVLPPNWKLARGTCEWTVRPGRVLQSQHADGHDGGSRHHAHRLQASQTPFPARLGSSYLCARARERGSVEGRREKKQRMKERERNAHDVMRKSPPGCSSFATLSTYSSLRLRPCRRSSLRHTAS